MKGYVSACAVMACATLAHAQPAAPWSIALDVDPCAEVDAAEVERLARIELDALAASTTRPRGAVRIPVAVGCRDDRVMIRVDDTITDKALERSLHLRRTTASARPRLLALAIVELMVASWAELEAGVAPAGEPEGDDAARAAHAVATARMQVAKPTDDGARARVMLLAGGTHFFTRLGLAAGGGLRGLVDVRRRWTLGLDLRFEHAQADASLGAVAWDGFSAAPALLAHTPFLRGRIDLRAGALARIGLGRMTGSPASNDRTVGRSFDAAWAGAGATFGASWRPISRWILDASIEAGHVVRPMGGLVADAREIAVQGPFVGAALSVGAVLD